MSPRFSTTISGEVGFSAERRKANPKMMQTMEYMSQITVCLFQTLMAEIGSVAKYKQAAMKVNAPPALEAPWAISLSPNNQNPVATALAVMISIKKPMVFFGGSSLIGNGWADLAFADT